MGLGTAVLGLALGGAGAAFSSMASKKGGEEAQNAADRAADRLMDLARETGIPVENLLFAFNNPNLGNAPLAGASAAALQQLGMPIGGALQQGSPQGLLINAMGGAGLEKQKFEEFPGELSVYINRLRRGVEAGQSPAAASRSAFRALDANARQRLQQAASLAGFSGIHDFGEAQLNFERTSGQVQEGAEATAPQVQAGRLAALRSVSQLQQDFPVATASNIRDMEQRQIASRLRDLERNREEQLAEIAQQANVLRFNPGGAFGEVEEEFADQRFQLENTDALVRALTILEGQTSLGASGLSALQGSLNAPIGNALNAGQIQSQGQQFSGSLAARQVQALNQLRVAQEQFESGLRQNAIATRFGGDLADIQGKVEAAQNAADFTSQTGSMLSGGGMGGGGAGGFGGGGGASAPATGGSLLRSLGG